MQLSRAGVLATEEEESVKEKEDFDSCMDDITTPEHAEIELPSSEQLIHDQELNSEVMIPAQETSSKLMEDEAVEMILQKTRRDDEEDFERMVRQKQDGANENEDVVTVKGPRVPAFVVHVTRPAEVEESRKDLPIVMMEQEIMEAINYHPAVIISGQTGCGKTTQVPQVSFLIAVFWLPFLTSSLILFLESLSFFMKLVLVQSNSVLEVGLSGLLNHAVSLSLPLPRESLWSLVFVLVKKLVFKLGTTKRLVKTRQSSS